MLSQKQILLIASVLGLLAVSLGAFGAHALKPMLTATGRLDTYELAVRYHFYSTFALLGVGLLMEKYKAKSMSLSGLLFLIGTIMFCGSLYTLCLTGITKFAIITPFGGVFFILGWLLFFLGVVK